MSLTYYQRIRRDVQNRIANNYPVNIPEPSIRHTYLDYYLRNAKIITISENTQENLKLYRFQYYPHLKFIILISNSAFRTKPCDAIIHKLTECGVDKNKISGQNTDIISDLLIFLHITSNFIDLIDDYKYLSQFILNL